ncbi:MAG: hypothetical protein ACI37R_04545 [Candidatus Avigastranaerophilus sp.]
MHKKTNQHQNQKNFVLQGGIREDIYYKEPDSSSKSKQQYPQFSDIPFYEPSVEQYNVTTDYKEQINQAKQDYALTKYKIQQKENEIKSLENQKTLLKQQQLQNQKMINSLNKQPSNLTKINSNFVKPAISHQPIEQDLSLMKRKKQSVINEDLNRFEKMQNRADVLYGSDDEYYQKYFQQFQNRMVFEPYPGQNPYEFSSYNPSVSKIPAISDPDKLFFLQGTLADMPLQKKYDLTLYGNEINALKKKANLDEKRRTQKPQRHSILNDIGIDYIHNEAIKKEAIKKYGPEAAENLHMSKAEFYMNTDYARQHTIFDNYLQVDSNLQDYLKGKISEQVGEDNLLTTQGIYIEADSNSSKRLAQALVDHLDFLKIVINNKKALNNNLHINSSIHFKDKNFGYALGNADILDMHINKNGELDLLIADTYDFNEGEASDLVRTARIRQERGQIIPYFIIYHVIIPKNIRTSLGDK